jgi:hypothetical protein
MLLSGNQLGFQEIDFSLQLAYLACEFANFPMRGETQLVLHSVEFIQFCLTSIEFRFLIDDLQLNFVRSVSEFKHYASPSDPNNLRATSSKRGKIY